MNVWDRLRTTFLEALQSFIAYIACISTGKNQNRLHFCKPLIYWRARGDNLASGLRRFQSSECLVTPHCCQS